MDSYQHIALGRQIHDLMTGDGQNEEALKEVIKEALCGKSIATLKSRVASITTFGRWKKSISLPEEVAIFPFQRSWLTDIFVSSGEKVHPDRGLRGS